MRTTVSFLSLSKDEPRGSRPLSPPHSQHFENIDQHGIGEALPGAKKDGAIKPVIAGIAAVEARVGAHVIERRIDRLAGSNPCEHVFRPVAKAEIAHVDNRPVMRFDDVACIELRIAVLMHGLPVGPDIHHRAGKPLAFDGSADDRDGAPARALAAAAFHWRRKFGADAAEWFESGCVHGLTSLSSVARAK